MKHGNDSYSVELAETKALFGKKRKKTKVRWILSRPENVMPRDSQFDVNLHTWQPNLQSVIDHKSSETFFFYCHNYGQLTASFKQCGSRH